MTTSDSGKSLEGIRANTTYLTDPNRDVVFEASTGLEHYCNLKVFDNPKRLRKTGIVCTIGPASRKIEVLKEMIKSGMNIARMNFSHGTHEYHKGTIELVRQAVEEVNKELNYPITIAIALDTKGPEIRSGLLAGDPNKDIELKAGGKMKVTNDEKYKEAVTSEVLYVDYANISKVVKPGSRIFIDDGLMSLVVDKIEGGEVFTTVENGGLLGSRKGCNLPGTNVDLPAVSEKDKQDLLFGVEMGVDMVFASFIRDGHAVTQIRKVFGDNGKKIKIISKIENHQGVENIDDILNKSDGIMVARGDLGIEIAPEKVFIAQKMMCARANRANKPVIVATQMLESMVTKPRPTRAEVSDVGNAVLDGADCVMLSGETAKGSYPVKSVLMQHHVSLAAEDATYLHQYFEELRKSLPTPMDAYFAVCSAAVEASLRIHASSIIVLTTSGTTAQCLSMFRPRCPVIAVTRDQQVARQLHLYRGIVPIFYEKARQDVWTEDVQSRVDLAMRVGMKRNMIADGDAVIVITGWATGSGFTNTMRIMWAPDGLPKNAKPKFS